MPLTTKKIDVLSANNLAVDEMPLARSLMYIKKNKCLNLNPVEYQQVQESMQKFGHLILLFGVCYLENFELVSVVVQLYPYI